MYYGQKKNLNIMNSSKGKEFLRTLEKAVNNSEDVSPKNTMKQVKKAFESESGVYIMGLVDEHGNPIERTPAEYPYNYDTHVIKRWGDNEEVNGTAWSDRLKREFPDQFQKYFNGHWGWDEATHDQLKDFLNDCFDYKIEKVILLMKGCNQFSGFPYWVVQYKYEEE